MGNHLEVTAGAFWRKIPDAIAYEASIPLVYEGHWLVESVRLIPNSTLCVGKYENLPECSIIHHVKNLLLLQENEIDLLNELQNLDTFTYGHTVEKRALDFLGDALNFCCGVATDHELNDIFTNEKVMESKISLFNKGLSSGLTSISQNSQAFTAFQNVTKYNFEKIVTQLEKTQVFLNKLKNSAQINRDFEYEVFMATLENQFELAKNSIKITNLIKKLSILNSCKQHHIPAAVLKPEIFKKDLQKLKKQLRNAEQGLAIPDSDFLRHFFLPICDCSLTENKIYLRIKIPIITRDKYWKLYELITTPFSWSNQTCSIKHDTTILAISNSPIDKEIRQISGLGLHDCKPSESKLCFLPRFVPNHLYGPDCARTLFNGATVNEISQNCPLICHTSSQTLISEIDIDVFVITNPTENMKISCQNKVTSLLETNHDYPGAIKLTLPCYCKLMTDKNILIPEKYPCDKTDNHPTESDIVHIIPAAWTTLQSFILNPTIKSNQPRFTNLSECLNTNWTLDIPIFNLTSNKQKVQNILDNLNNPLEIIETLNRAHHGDTLFLIWNILLSAAVIYLLFKNANGLVLLTQARNVNGENGKYNYDIILILIICSILAYIGCIIIKLIITRLKKKQHMAQNDIETTTPQRYIMDIEDISNLEDITAGKRLVCIIKPVT